MFTKERFSISDSVFGLIKCSNYNFAPTRTEIRHGRSLFLFDDSLRLFAVPAKPIRTFDKLLSELINMSRTIPILELFHAVPTRILLAKEWSVKLEWRLNAKVIWGWPCWGLIDLVFLILMNYMLQVICDDCSVEIKSLKSFATIYTLYWALKYFFWSFSWSERRDWFIEDWYLLRYFLILF